MYRVHLTEAQRAELQRRTRDPKSLPRTRNRLEMVRLADLGWSIPRIAGYLRQSDMRVRYWVKQFLASGFDGLPDQPHVGQQSRLTPVLVQAIRQEIERSQRSWTAVQIAAWLAAEHGVRLTPDHLGRRLKQARLSYKRTARSLRHKQDPEQVAVRQAELAALEKGERTDAWISAM